MALRCPRCEAELVPSPPLESFPRGSLEVARCASCGGHWLSGAALSQAHPTLNGASLRRGALAPERGPHAPPAPCPRCREVMVAFYYFGVLIDACVGCRGVWLDAGELTSLSRSIDRAEGHAAPGPEGADRRAAAQAVREGSVTCVHCGSRVPTREALGVRGGHAWCLACFLADPPSVEPDPELDALREELRAGSGAHGDVWSYLCEVGGAVGTLLSSQPVCERCHCRQTSDCPH